MSGPVRKVRNGAMEKMILGIDIGTTSLKAAVFNQQGEQLAAAVVEYTLLTPGPQLVEAP